jgi:hypothetical protein
VTDNINTGNYLRRTDETNSEKDRALQDSNSMLCVSLAKELIIG